MFHRLMVLCFAAVATAAVGFVVIVLRNPPHEAMVWLRLHYPGCASPEE